MIKNLLITVFVVFTLLIVTSAIGVWTNGTVSFLEATDTTAILVTKYDTLSWLATKSELGGGPGGGQQYSDTTSWDATKTYVITNYQNKADTLTWDATKTYVSTNAQQDGDTTSWDATRYWVTTYVDSNKVLYWTDTTLANGIATNYDVNAKADSSTAIYWADTSLANGVVTNYDLSQLFSPYTRNYGYVYKNTGATTASTVGLVAPTLTATVASNDQTSRAFVQHTSAATANSPTGLISTTFTQFRRDYEPDFYAVVRTGADISSIAFNIGFTSAAFDTNRAPNRYEMKFSFHTGVTGETTWQTITNNNSGAGQSKKILVLRLLRILFTRCVLYATPQMLT